MRHAVLALLLVAIATPVAAAAAAADMAPDDAEARRLVEAAADALGRLPRVYVETRGGKDEVLTVLREPGVGLEARDRSTGVLVLGEEVWDLPAPTAGWKRRADDPAAARAFVAEMDASNVPLTTEGFRTLLARAESVTRVASPDGAAADALGCTPATVALVYPVGDVRDAVTVELHLCAEDARLHRETIRYRFPDGSVRTEHARYLDAGERRLTRP